MAQVKFTIQQGESQQFIASITKDGVNVDLTSAINIYAEIQISGKDEVSIPYALQAESGRSALIVNPVADHEILLPMERDQSRTLDVGLIVCNVIVITSDLAFPDGQKVDEFSNIIIGNMTKGNLKDVEV